MISVLTPSCRKDRLEVTQQCLQRQTLQDYEWLVCSPEDQGFGHWIEEPKRNEGDFYGFNKALNALFRAAKGQVVAVICDSTWFPSGTLFRMWRHFEQDPKLCVRGQGNQFLRFGPLYLPEDMCWVDPLSGPQMTEDLAPLHMEFRLASLPMQAVLDCGGVDEEFDQVAAWSEKDMCVRMSELGYKFLLDRGLEFRFVRHEDHGPEWEKKAEEALKMIHRNCAQLTLGLREPRLNYL